MKDGVESCGCAHALVLRWISGVFISPEKRLRQRGFPPNKKTTRQRRIEREVSSRLCASRERIKQRVEVQIQVNNPFSTLYPLLLYLEI